MDYLDIISTKISLLCWQLLLYDLRLVFFALVEYLIVWQRSPWAIDAAFGWACKFALLGVEYNRRAISRDAEVVQLVLLIRLF